MKGIGKKARILAMALAAVCFLEFCTADLTWAQKNVLNGSNSILTNGILNGYITNGYITKEGTAIQKGEPASQPNTGNSTQDRSFASQPNSGSTIQEEGSAPQQGSGNGIPEGEADPEGESALQKNTGNIPQEEETSSQPNTGNPAKEEAFIQGAGTVPPLNTGNPAKEEEPVPQQDSGDAAQPAGQSGTAESETLTYGNYEYKITDSGTAAITGYSGKEKALSIPSKIGQAAVSSIAPYAIASLDAERVTIPSSVRTVEANAFSRSYYIKQVTVEGKDTLFADSAFYFVQGITFVCASNSKAYIYARENKAKASLTDGIDLAKAKISLGKKTIVQNESDDMRVSVTVTVDGKKLQEGRDYTCTWPSYFEKNSVGEKKVTVTAVPYNDGYYTGSKTAAYQVIPMASKALYATKKITASSIQLTWSKVEGVSGYYLYRCGISSAKYKLVADISKQSKSSYTDKGLKKNTGYKYRLVPYQKANGKIYKAKATDLTAYTASGKAAVNSKKKVKMKTRKISLKAAVNTDTYKQNWAQVSPVSDFFDAKGRYTIAYSDAKYVYIQILDNSTLKVTKTIKAKKRYSLVGAVAGGPDGNYYIVWGQRNWKSGGVVLDVSKYNAKGKFIKSCKLYNTGDNMDTADPFEAGNCAVAFQGNVLVCSYARQMNNVHQSNDVFCVNIKNMKEDSSYNSYVSHSFDQRVLPLANGDVMFADLGDAFPRGFSLSESGTAHSWEAVPFHFYGESGDNYTNARLGGIGEVPTGIALVGSSAPSMAKKYEKENQQLFLQVISPVTGEPVFSGSKRKGTSCGNSCTDTGIKWLTKYKNASVRSSGMAVMENGQILAVWDKITGRKLESYYMVLSPTGATLRKATKIGDCKLNDCEEIKYQKGYIYWTTANGQKSATVHKLYVGK